MPKILFLWSNWATATVDKFKRRAFKTIINNRPDGEEPNQPLQTDIVTKAQQAGSPIIYLPVVGGQLTCEQWTVCRDFLIKQKTRVYVLSFKRQSAKLKRRRPYLIINLNRQTSKLSIILEFVKQFNAVLPDILTP